jgi:hypothetical protein
MITLEITPVELILLAVLMAGALGAVYVLGLKRGWGTEAIGVREAEYLAAYPERYHVVEIMKQNDIIDRIENDKLALKLMVDNGKRAIAQKEKMRARYRRLLIAERSKSSAKIETTILKIADVAENFFEDSMRFDGIRRSETMKKFDEGVETGAIQIIEVIREEALAFGV